MIEISVDINHYDDEVTPDGGPVEHLPYLVDFIAKDGLSGHVIVSEIAQCISEFVRAKGWTDDVTIAK